jgi:urease accessory protein
MKQRGAEWMGEVDVAVAADDFGRLTFPILRSKGALAVRATGEEAYIVGAGAHPIGGDRLRIGVDVGPGGRLMVRSSSATLARPSVPPSQSLLAVDATVGDGGSLSWAPEPCVAAVGSDHFSSARVSLAERARLCWSDAVVLGRAGEAPGSWSNALRVEVAGRPLVSTELALGPAHPAWSSPSVLAGARAASSLLVVDPERPAPAATVLDGLAGYLVPLGAHAFVAVTWGATYAECRRALGALSEAGQVGAWLDVHGQRLPPAASVLTRSQPVDARAITVTISYSTAAPARAVISA